MVKALGSYLDNGTLETLTRAEQLSANLTDLNERIEGTEQHRWSAAQLTFRSCLLLMRVSRHRDDPRLGAVQHPAGCGARTGQAEYGGGSGHSGLDEEDGPVPAGAHRHGRVG